jgi:hypothetical protein
MMTQVQMDGPTSMQMEQTWMAYTLWLVVCGYGSTYFQHTD